MPTVPRPVLLSLALLAAIASWMPLSPALANSSGQSAKPGNAVKAARPSRTGMRRSTQLARADRDGSGSLSRDEVRAGAPRLLAQFDAIDANHDGELSPQELRAWSRSHAQQRGRDGGTALATHFTRADADGNGLLSRDEARVHLPRLAVRFDRVDANHDGVITAEEWADYMKARRDRRLASAGGH